MLYVYIQNVTKGKRLARRDGTADYDVAVAINNYELAHFRVLGHKRDAGWAELLRLVAEKGVKQKRCKGTKCAFCEKNAARREAEAKRTVAKTQRAIFDILSK